MKRILYIALGSLAVAIGAIGIFVPGLPTTTFLLIAAFFYFRSSERLYNWLLNHKVYGKFIRDYQKYKAISLKHKILSLTMMWLFITLSLFYFKDNIWIVIILLLCGIAGTLMVLSVATLNKNQYH